MPWLISHNSSWLESGSAKRNSTAAEPGDWIRTSNTDSGMGHVYLAPNSKNHLCYFYLVFLAHYSIILWIAFIYSSDVSTKLQHRLNMEKDEMDKTVIVSKLLRCILPDGVHTCLKYLVPGTWYQVPEYKIYICTILCKSWLVIMKPLCNVANSIGQENLDTRFQSIGPFIPFLLSLSTPPKQ